MASSVNRFLCCDWLPKRASMALSCLLGITRCASKKRVLFLNITRRSKIVSQAVARCATTSVDHLQCAVVPKIACVICAVLFIDACLKEELYCTEMYISLQKYCLFELTDRLK